MAVPQKKWNLHATQKDGCPTTIFLHKVVVALHLFPWDAAPSTNAWSVQFEIAVLWLVRAATKAIMGLATVVTPVVSDRKYLPLHPVAGTCNHFRCHFFVAHYAYPTFRGLYPSMCGADPSAPHFHFLPPHRGSPPAGCLEDRYSLRGRIWQHALGGRKQSSTPLVFFCNYTQLFTLT